MGRNGIKNLELRIWNYNDNKLIKLIELKYPDIIVKFSDDSTLIYGKWTLFNNL